jgi:hypothetical protein
MMKTLLRLSLLTLFLVSLSAAAQPMDWNMVGSAGSIDPATTALGNLQFVNMTAQHAGGALGQITLRYPVTNTFGSSSGTFLVPWNRMEVGHIDNGAGGFVIARLFQVNRCTNAQVQIAVMNSVDGGGVTVCPIVPIAAGALPLNFAANIYYIQVTIFRNNVAFNPSLQYVALL